MSLAYLNSRIDQVLATKPGFGAPAPAVSDIGQSPFTQPLPSISGVDDLVKPVQNFGDVNISASPLQAQIAQALSAQKAQPVLNPITPGDSSKGSIVAPMYSPGTGYNNGYAQGLLNQILSFNPQNKKDGTM